MARGEALECSTSRWGSLDWKNCHCDFGEGDGANMKQYLRFRFCVYPDIFLSQFLDVK